MEEKNFRQIMKKDDCYSLPGKGTLKMREEYSSFAPQSAKVYQELSALEFADLVDLKNKNWEVYGNIN